MTPSCILVKKPYRLQSRETVEPLTNRVRLSNSLMWSVKSSGSPSSTAAIKFCRISEPLIPQPVLKTDEICSLCLLLKVMTDPTKTAAEERQAESPSVPWTAPYEQLRNLCDVFDIWDVSCERWKGRKDSPKEVWILWNLQTQGLDPAGAQASRFLKPRRCMNFSRC